VIRAGAAALCACASALLACGPTTAQLPARSAASSQPPARCAGDPRHGSREPSLVETRSSTTAAVGRTVNDLDGQGRLVTTRIDLDGDGQFEQTVNRAYDSAGRLVEVRELDRTQRFLRDRDGRVVTRETEARGRIVTRVAITHDDRGRVTRELGDLDDVRYVYDQAGCQTREQHYRPDSEAPYIDLEATCDASGRRVSRRGNDGSGPIHETWRYDDHGRLVAQDIRRDGTLALTTRVSYDDAGHRIAEEYRDGQGTLTGRRTWTYAGDDILGDQIDDLADASWVRTTYRYDGSRPADNHAACSGQMSQE
jgi:hypothetical protein